MSRHLRRFELLIPLRFNDGRRVPEPLLAQTQKEIEREFGAVSVESQVIRGFDRATGAQDDRMVRLFADVDDTAENLAYFMRLKETLKSRFEQDDIWIATHAVEVL